MEIIIIGTALISDSEVKINTELSKYAMPYEV
jgi:hypothetical protein